MSFFLRPSFQTFAATDHGPMEQTLFHFSDLQQQSPSLAERYAIRKESDFNSLLNDDKINVDFFLQLVALFQSEHELPIVQLKSFPVPVILDYLERTHRYYLGIKLLEIEQSIQNLYWRIPENELLPYLVSFFEWIQKNLAFHIQMEEQQLFPYIQTLLRGEKGNADFSVLSFMDHHSDTVELQISEVKKHIVRAQQTATEIFPFRVLLKQLDSFEKDLRIHARIEEEVLVPLTMEMEQNSAS